MAKLTPKKRIMALKSCIKRDGERCYICFKTPFELLSPLILEHKDNNPHNNPRDGSNHGAACRGCNARKNPRGAGKRGLRGRDKIHKLHGVSEREREREREREKEAEARAVPAEMKKNVEVEGRFRLWLWTVIEQTGPWSYLEVLNSGAEVAGCSQQSIKRYLDKCCSRTGRFMLTGMKPDLLVELRPIPVEQSARPAKQDKATPGKEIMGLHAKILKAGA